MYAAPSQEDDRRKKRSRRPGEKSPVNGRPDFCGKRAAHGPIEQARQKGGEAQSGAESCGEARERPVVRRAVEKSQEQKADQKRKPHAAVRAPLVAQNVAGAAGGCSVQRIGGVVVRIVGTAVGRLFTGRSGHDGSV